MKHLPPCLIMITLPLVDRYPCAAALRGYPCAAALRGGHLCYHACGARRRSAAGQAVRMLPPLVVSKRRCHRRRRRRACWVPSPSFQPALLSTWIPAALAGSCRWILLLVSPEAALLVSSPPLSPLQQCLALNAWTVLVLGMLLPLLVLHRMEQPLRLSLRQQPGPAHAAERQQHHGGSLARRVVGFLSCDFVAWIAIAALQRRAPYSRDGL